MADPGPSPARHARAFLWVRKNINFRLLTIHQLMVDIYPDAAGNDGRPKGLAL